MALIGDPEKWEQDGADMTRERIAEGLEVLTLQLANGLTDAGPPEGWLPHEWAYVKGIASHAIWIARARLLAGPL